MPEGALLWTIIVRMCDLAFSVIVRFRNRKGLILFLVIGCDEVAFALGVAASQGGKGRMLRRRRRE